MARTTSMVSLVHLRFLATAAAASSTSASSSAALVPVTEFTDVA